MKKLLAAALFALASPAIAQDAGLGDAPGDYVKVKGE